MSDTGSLPRDPDLLIGMIADLHDENDKLRAIVETLKRTLFGARSEKLAGDAAQLLLALDDMSTAPREPEPEQATRQPRARPASGKPARNIGGLPKHLPREDVVIEPEANECPCCQGALHRIGEDVSEMLASCLLVPPYRGHGSLRGRKGPPQHLVRSTGAAMSTAGPHGVSLCGPRPSVAAACTLAPSGNSHPIRRPDDGLVRRSPIAPTAEGLAGTPDAVHDHREFPRKRDPCLAST